MCIRDSIYSTYHTAQPTETPFPFTDVPESRWSYPYIPVSYTHLFIYFPAMTSVLAWVSARYLGVLCGFDITGGPVMVLALSLIHIFWLHYIGKS